MTYKELHELLNAISTEELKLLTRSVKKRFKSHGNAFKIYNLLKSKNFKPSHIQHIKNKGVYLSRLKNFILSELITYDDNKIEEQIIRFINYARVLFERKQYKWAYNHLEKAIDLAEKYDLLNYKLIIYFIHQKTYSYGYLAPEKFSLQNTAITVNKLLTDFEELLVHTNVAIEHLQIGNSKHQLSEKDIEKYKTTAKFRGKAIWSLKPLILPEVSKNAGFSVKFLGLLNTYKSYRFLLDFENSLQTINKLIHLVEEHPHMLHFQPNRMKSLLHDRMCLFMHLKRYNDMLKDIVALEGFMKKHSSLPNKLFYRQYLLIYKLEAFYQLTKAGQNQHQHEIENLLSDVYSFYKKHNKEYDRQAKVWVIFNLSVLAFSLQKYKLALEYLNEYFHKHSKKSDIRPDLYFSARLLEVAIQVSFIVIDFNVYTNSDKTRIKNLTKGVIENFKEHNRTFKIEYNVLDFSLTLLKVKEEKNLKPVIQKFSTCLNQIVKNNKHERHFLTNGVNWLDWYKRLLENT